MKKKGKVYLVGAGPGDPGLITQRALDLLKKAEVVFYDNLVNPRLLEKATAKAQLINVGKRGEGTSADQEEIEARIVKVARKGKTVVRLKGGDPFIFGRGGEEAERLGLEGIPFEVVPGVSSPIAVPAYAGIPLTHRDFTHSITFVTGHAQASLDWQALSKMGTLVFVMGVKTIRKNMDSLLSAGMNPLTPAAVIRWGSYPWQQTIVATVNTLADEIERIRLMPPGIVVVGDVVRLREKINWYESLPLFGKKILVTRARAGASELSARLEELGAEVLEVPTIQILPPPSWKPLDQALKRLNDYRWLLFTSVNGVQSFFERLKKLGKDIRELKGVSLGAVGPATAKALEQYSLQVDRIPEKFSGKSLARVLPKAKVRGKRILVPRALEGGEDLICDLKSKGARVEAVAAYQNRPDPQGPKKILELGDGNKIQLILFASSSSVKNFHRLLKGPPARLFLQIPCLCIGPSTEKTARDLGFKRVLVSDEATLDSLVEKTLAHLSSENPGPL